MSNTESPDTSGVLEKYAPKGPAPTDFRETYMVLLNQMREIDEDLDIAQDPKAASVKVVKERLIEKQEERIVRNFEGFSKALDEMADEATQVGVYFGLMTALAEKYEDRFEKFVDELAKQDPQTSGAVLTEAQQEEIQKYRAVIYKNANMLRELAISLKASEGDFPTPKKRTGRSGPRGPREISNYTWSIGGKELSEDNDNLNYVAKEYGFESPAKLREQLAAANGLENLRDPKKDLSMQITKPGETESVTLLGKRIVPKGTPIMDPDEADAEENAEEGVETSN